MRRTRLRPLPDGRLSAIEALAFAGDPVRQSGSSCSPRASISLSAAVALATLASYVVVYTPLKKRTSFATVIGAIPGALPPVIGWAAADERAVAGRLGAVRDRVPLAAAALPGHRLDLPRGLRARGPSDAAGDRAGRPQHGTPGGRLYGRAAARWPRADARRHVRARPISRARWSLHADIPGTLDAVRDDARGARTRGGCSSRRSSTCRCSGY